MFSILLFLVFLSELSVSSSVSLTNITKELHNRILNSLNVNELNVTTLDVLLTKLNLRNCSNTEPNNCHKRCVRSESVFERHSLSTSKAVNAIELAELSTTLLYFLLPEKNPGAKDCQNGDNRSSLYGRVLQYYQTNGLICARLLDRMLRDLKKEFRDSSIIEQKCISAAELFREINRSTEQHEVSKNEFPTLSLVIISHLLNGSCVNVKDDHELELPCKSYFSISLLEHFGGADGQLSFEGFEKMLASVGLGKKRNYVDTDEHDDEKHDHDHKRKRRDIPDESAITQKKCYSADDFAEIFYVNKTAGVDDNAIIEISPALIQQLESKSCVKAKTDVLKTTNGDSDKKVWLYGFVSVLMISLLSLAGVAVIPTMKGKTYKKIIIVLVGLAIGTLTGDALFHLIPHAAGFHAGSHGEHGHVPGDGDEKAFLWKFLVVASGVYGFFMFETLTHLFLIGGHGHSHNEQFEHTRRHSPFKRNNSCRTMERHEMRLASSSCRGAPADTTQVIFNQASGKTEEKSAKDGRIHDHSHDNIPSLLTESNDDCNSKTKINSVGWMIIIGDTIHNITDGIAIGAAFTQDIGGGLSTSIAVFCHELPHELGDFAVLISSGMTVKQAMLANFLSACSSFVGLVIGILIGQQTENGNQWVFAVMGGMFLYVALVDMLPELIHSEELGGERRLQIFLLQNFGMLLGFIIMLLIAYYEEDLVISW